MEQISKQEFLAEFNKIYADPQNYLVKDGKVDMSAVTELFNKFASVYLHPAMQGIVSDENLPKISVQKLTLLPDSRTDDKSSTGRYDRDHNFIEINARKFENPSKASLQKALLSVLPILCHEYQHFKQGLYAMGKVNKPKVISKFPEQEETFESTTLTPEQIEKVGTMIGLDPEKVKEDFLFGDKKNKLIEFAKTVEPEIYNSAKRKTYFFTTPGSDRVLMAYYYRRPAEQDARETSIATYDTFVSDSDAFNKTFGGKLPVGAMKSASRIQKFKNWTDLHKQPESVMETFDNQAKNINASHFLLFSAGIDNSKLASSDFKTRNDEGRKIVVMESALICILGSKSPAERKQFLQTLQEKAESAEDRHLLMVVSNVKEKMDSQGSKTSVVSKTETEQTKSHEPQREINSPTKTQSAKKSETKTLEDEQGKSMQ